MMKQIVLIALIVLIGVSSCSQDITVSGMDADGQSIVFATSVERSSDVTRGSYSAIPLSGEGSQLWLLPSVKATEDGDLPLSTRGSQVRDVDEMSSFGVSAFCHAASDVNLSNVAPSYFYNLEAVKSGDNYVITQDHFWPSNDDVLDFQAYHPYNDANIALSAVTQTGDQTIEFTVNSDVAAQCDLMTATAQDVSFRTNLTPSVSLKFYHRLCAVRFVVGRQFVSQGYVKSITLKGIYSKGTYTLGQPVGSGWTPDATTKGNFVLTHTADKNLNNAVAGDAITDVDETFLVIPQDFTGDETASIEVLYWDGTRDITVSASLEDEVWAEGTTVTYALSSEKLTTLQVSSIGFPSTVSGSPKTSWSSGDQVGLYVVDGTSGDHKQLVYRNIAVTYDGTQWNVDHTTAQGTLFHKPGYLYYFYYPYKAGTPDGYPEESPKVDATGEEFFASIINAWTLDSETEGNHSDQSTESKFLSADLQVCRGEMAAPVSTVAATMVRQVGLARFQFAQEKYIPTTITRSNNSTPTTSGSNRIAPSTNFLTNKPYLSGGTYYFWTKAGETVTFNSNPSDTNHWKEAVNINLAAGAYTSDADMVTVQDYRYTWICTGTATYTFSYNSSKTYYTLEANDLGGTYTMQCWGASGGGGLTDNVLVANDISLGGYTYGQLTLAESKTLYIYVGQHGTDGTLNTNVIGGWNGGGSATCDGTDNESAGGGGGATDIRLVNGSWNSFASLKSRIMVAGGGGGATYYLGARTTKGGYGGGLSGGDSSNGTKGGTQTSGYKFGIGQDGKGVGGPLSGNNVGAGGGGGGYYGGCADQGTGVAYDWREPYYYGAGGSSFVSGMTGCVAIDASSEEDNIIQSIATDKTVHYSGLKFINALTIAGNGSMPNPEGSGNITGRAGHGYCRIVLTH